MRTFHYDRIADDIRTVDDLQFFASQIDLLLVSLFQANQAAFQETMDNKLPRDLGNLIGESLREQNVLLTDHEGLQQYFHGLKDYLTHLPVLQLTVAYHPTGEQVDQLSDWIREKTGKTVILHLHYDPRVLGGAIVTYGGKYADLSVKKRMDTVYEAKKPEILAMLK